MTDNTNSVVNNNNVEEEMTNSATDAMNNLSIDKGEEKVNTTTTTTTTTATPQQEEKIDPKANLNEKQLAKLSKIHNLVFAAENELTEREKKFCDDACLLRYLRARDWKVSKSYPMLLNTLKWRREFKPDDIYAKDLIFEASSAKLFKRGFDLAGRPTIFMSPAKENSKDYEKNIQLLVYTIESAIADMSPRVEQMAWVIDFNGYSTRNAPPISVAKETLNILSNHYPERLGVALLVDPPFIFSLFFSAIKPFINHVTREKIVFCSGNKEEQSKIISNLFDMNDLPERFGGKSKWEFSPEFWDNEQKADEERKAKL